MTITLTRAPRTNLVLRVNELLNPSFTVNTNSWNAIGGFGTGGAGTDARNSINWSPYGSWAYQKQWTTAPTGAVNGVVGWRYALANPGSAGQVRTFSARVITSWTTTVSISAKYINSTGGIISVTTGAAVPTGAGTWGQPFVVATNPAGTASINFEILLGSTLPPSNGLATLQTAMSETKGFLDTYFDGDTYATGFGTQHTEWTGTAGASQSQLLDVNPADVLSPQLVLGYDVAQASRNIVHQLIDGPVAATLLPASTRQGTLKLFFIDAATADTARIAHTAATAWDLADTDQPQEATRYVVDGQVRKYQTDNRLRWVLEVPYRELT